jgi:hypothetical protein
MTKFIQGEKVWFITNWLDEVYAQADFISEENGVVKICYDGLTLTMDKSSIFKTETKVRERLYDAWSKK